MGLPLVELSELFVASTTPTSFNSFVRINVKLASESGAAGDLLVDGSPVVEAALGGCSGSDSEERGWGTRYGMTPIVAGVPRRTPLRRLVRGGG